MLNKNFLFILGILLVTPPYCQALNRQTFQDVPTLLKARVSKDPAIRTKAYHEPSQLDESDIPALLKELNNDDPDIHAIVMNMLGNLGLEKKLGGMENDVIAGLRNLLKSEHGFARQGAAISLTMMDRHSFGKEMVPFLVEAVKERSPRYELDAVRTLGQIGPDAKDAVPAIIEALKRQPERDRLSYYLALTFIGTPEALEASKGLIRKMMLLRQYSDTKGALSAKPWPNLIAALGFICLFWWSRWLRRAGGQVSCLPLLIPAAAWSLITIWAVLYRHYYYPLIAITANDAPPPSFLILHVKYNTLFPKLLILATMAGIIPWLISLWRWRKNRVASVSPP